jgi:hypothetical protein
MNEQKRQSYYASRAKRIAFNAAVAVSIAALFFWVVYLTWLQLQAGRNWAIALGLGAVIVLFSAFSLSIQELQRAIVRRGYERPVSTQGFSSVVKGLFDTEQPNASHPVEYKRQTKTVRFDGGSVVVVDLGELYFTLLQEYQEKSVLPWSRCVVERNMDKKQWAAYRQLLLDAEVVKSDGRGALQLTCPPWSAIETIKRVC